MTFTHIWNFILIQSVNQKLLAISHLFSPFSHLFWVWPSQKKVWNIFFSPNSLTYWLLPTYEISYSYRQSIRSYWQFHTFFPHLHPFFGCGHVKKRCEIYFFSPNSLTYWLLPTYEISYTYRQSIRSYWQFHTFFPHFHTFFGCGQVKKRCEIYFFVGSHVYIDIQLLVKF